MLFGFRRLAISATRFFVVFDHFQICKISVYHHDLLKKTRVILQDGKISLHRQFIACAQNIYWKAWDLFSHASSAFIPTFALDCMDIFLLVRPVDQQGKQPAVRFYSKRCFEVRIQCFNQGGCAGNDQWQLFAKVEQTYRLLEYITRCDSHKTDYNMPTM